MRKHCAFAGAAQLQHSLRLKREVLPCQVWTPPQELVDSYSSGIEKVLGYKFQKRALLQEALTHTSWPDATQQVSVLPSPS